MNEPNWWVVGGWAAFAAISAYSFGLWIALPDTVTPAAPIEPANFVSEYQTLITGVIALGVGVATVMRLSTQIASARDDTDREIRAQNERWRADAVNDRIAHADTISNLVLIVAVEIERTRRGMATEPLTEVPRFVVEECVDFLIEAHRIDGRRLGAALGAFIRDSEEFRQIYNHPILGPSEGPAAARRLQIRSRLLAEAFQSASRSLEARGDIPVAPLLTTEMIGRLPDFQMPDDDEIGWIHLVMKERETWSA